MKTLNEILKWKLGFYTYEEELAACVVVMEGTNPGRKIFCQIDDGGKSKAECMQWWQEYKKLDPESNLLYIDEEYVPTHSLGEWLQGKFREYFDNTVKYLIIRIPRNILCMAAADLQAVKRRTKESKRKKQ